MEQTVDNSTQADAFHEMKACRNMTFHKSPAAEDTDGDSAEPMNDAGDKANNKNDGHLKQSLLFTMDEGFWAGLDETETARMKCMLQAISMFQQQLRQNERIISDLHEQIEGKEKTCQRLRRRAQQAGHQSEQAKLKETKMQMELEKCLRLQEARSKTASEAIVEELHSELKGVKEQIKSTTSEILAESTALEKLNLRISSSQAQREQHERHLAQLRDNYACALLQIQQQHASELDALRTENSESLYRLKEKVAAGLHSLKEQHDQEAFDLRASEDAVREDCRTSRASRDTACEQLVVRQQEGQQLLALYNEARQEALSTSSEIRQVLEHASPRRAGVMEEVLDLYEYNDFTESTELHRLCRVLEQERVKMLEHSIQVTRRADDHDTILGLEWQDCSATHDTSHLFTEVDQYDRHADCFSDAMQDDFSAQLEDEQSNQANSDADSLFMPEADREKTVIEPIHQLDQTPAFGTFVLGDDEEF